MSLNSVSLTMGMRKNLLSLQNTSKFINTTQKKLSSGKRVNSALDNPTNYFAAESHMQRADDLTARKDGMSEAVQMVKAADAGIKGIISLIESAKGVAQAAIAKNSAADRSVYAATFDTLLTQISQFASDSGYRGTNFLTGDSSSIEFSQSSGVSTLSISGFDATSSGLGISKTSASVTTVIDNNVSITGSDPTWAYTAPLSSSLALDDTYRLVSGSAIALVEFHYPDNHYAARIVQGTFSAGTATLEYNSSGFNYTTGMPNSVSAWSTTSGIQSSSVQLEGALTTLRSQSAKLSSNMNVVTTRQGFTSSMIDNLKTGADNLTLADMNEEGTNMLMMQTQQNLGITSLSMASQSAQSVMRLF